MQQRRIRTLPPIRPNPKHEDLLASKILQFLRTSLYQKVVTGIDFPKNTDIILNSGEDALTSAIRTGLVRYDGRSFTGKLSAAISQILRQKGARWKNGRWNLPAKRLDTNLQAAIKDAEIKEDILKERIDRLLSEIDPEAITRTFNPRPYLRTVQKNIESQFQRSVRGLMIQPKLSPQEDARITEEYVENLTLSIKHWLTEDIQKLRKQVLEHTFKGSRYESLAKVIESNYGVSKRKSRFLARQETNLLTAKLREVRYERAGIDEYLWVSVQGTANHPVRPLHQKLDAESKAGKIFRFSDPPVSGTKGEHQNPGEPYGCRCVARPVIRDQR